MRRAVAPQAWAAWYYIRPVVVIAVVLGGLGLLGAAGLTTGWLIVILLLWVLPVFVGYRLHVVKEREEPLALALFLGWIGVLIALTLSSNGRRCPRCDEVVRRDASGCRFCGADLE